MLPSLSSALWEASHTWLQVWTQIDQLIVNPGRTEMLIKKITIAERFVCVKEGNRWFEYFILERGIKRMKTNSEKQTDQLEKKENKRKRIGKENAFFSRSYRERNNLTRPVSSRYTRL